MIQVQGMAAVQPAILPTHSKRPNCSRLGERLNLALYAISFLSHQKGETKTCPNCMSSDHSDIHCPLAHRDEAPAPVLLVSSENIQATVTLLAQADVPKASLATAPPQTVQFS